MCVLYCILILIFVFTVEKANRRKQTANGKRKDKWFCYFTVFFCKTPLSLSFAVSYLSLSNSVMIKIKRKEEKRTENK